MRQNAVYRYFPVEHTCASPDADRYRVFGLRVLRSEDGEEEEVMLLPDVSTDFAFTLRLASLFTRKQLDPIHLLDVLEDIL